MEHRSRTWQRMRAASGVVECPSYGSARASSSLWDRAGLWHRMVGVGLPVEIAVQALTETPARAIGRAHDLGRLEAGYAADAVLLEPDFTVAGVWAAGLRLR